jgi:hypothetical protein
MTTEPLVPLSGCVADPLLVASECCCCRGRSTSAEDATGTVADWPALLSAVPTILLPDWLGTSLLSSARPRKHQHNDVCVAAASTVQNSIQMVQVSSYK